MSIAITALVWATLASGDAGIVIGENIRASRDETPYVEPYVACHPTRRGRCIAAATKFTGSRPDTPIFLVSSDGGMTWQEKRPNIGRLQHAVDAWVAFGDTGAAYAVFLVIEAGDSKTKIVVFRSDDAGNSWTGPTRIAAERSFDRPTVIARGSDVVVAAEHRGAVAVLHSRDEGRSFGPARLFRPSRNLDHTAMNLMWHGSSVVLPYVDYGDILGGSRLGMVQTNDFGRRWDVPVVVADVPRRFPGNAHFAVSGASLYAAFASGTVDSRTVSIARSPDGMHWQSAVRLSNEGAQAFRPAIAVSSRGDVGATWIEVEAGCTRLWFSVSRDGARTFSTPVPVSEEFSCGNSAANRTAYERWEHGGDYFGLASDGESFVAMWPDARTGTFQLYVSTIAVTSLP